MLSFASKDTQVAIAAVATTFAAYALYRTLGKSYSTQTLRGPPSPSFLSGHEELIVDYEIDQLEAWVKKYGGAFRIDSYFRSRGLCIADPKAAAFITSRPMEFSKTKLVIEMLLSWAGPGLFASEGEAHRKQVRLWVTLDLALGTHADYRPSASVE